MNQPSKQPVLPFAGYQTGERGQPINPAVVAHLMTGGGVAMDFNGTQEPVMTSTRKGQGK